MMKTRFVCVVILVICANFHLISTAAEAPTWVLDIGGNKVRAGVPYYIIVSSSSTNKGPGGITFECTRNNTCPVEVIKGDIGLPIHFSPVNPKKGVIRESTDLNIIFWYSSDVWKVNNIYGGDRRRARKYLLTTGGVMGNPGPQTLSNWFKLEKMGKGYKIMHCPSVCNYCKTICKNVGVFLEEGKLRLALTHDDKPLKIYFRQYYN